MLLTDDILGRSNRWLDTFDPLRATLRASAHEFTEENIDVAKHFVGDWAKGLLSGELRDLDRTEATVCRRDGDVFGVYRDESGDLHTVDAICPHLGCLVQWNDGERTWDCSCHGSRFEIGGRVINGPANTDLSVKDL
jgi:Rieske Fe-S protein